MKFNGVIRSSVAAIVMALFCQESFAGIMDQLNPEAQAKIRAGGQVSVYQDSGIPDAPWPICTVYQRIEASPMEAAAVFSDFNLQKTYIPNLVKSEIVSRRDRNVFDISYEVTLPMGFGKEEYVAQDVLTSYDNGSSYQVSWNVYPTSHIKKSVGRARFEPMADGTTLLEYQNFIIPNRLGSGMGWVVERAKKAVGETVAAIGAQIQKERVSNSVQLRNQVQILQEILGQ